jgi:hypothetical protein
MGTHLKIAALSEDSVAKIRALEAETGFHIMAFEPEVHLATPTADQLAKIKLLEKELKVTLLAYDA